MKINKEQDKTITGEEEVSGNLTRRDIIKQILAFTVAACFPSNTILAEEIKEEFTDKEKIDRFAKLMNSMKGEITQIDENNKKSKVVQSLNNNLNAIFRLLEKDHDLIDETSYKLFAGLNRIMREATNDGGKSFREILMGLSYHFAENGYFFNVSNQVNDEELFVEGENKTVVLSEYKGIVEVFKELPEGETAKLFYANYHNGKKADYNPGRTSFALPVIDLDDIDGLFKKTVESYKVKYNFMHDLSKEGYTKYVESNELTHQILYFFYGLEAETVHNWEDVDSGIPSYKIKSSHQVHEFLSDAVSINTEPRGFLTVFFLKATRYDYTFKFLANLMKSKIEEKKINIKYKNLDINGQLTELLKILTPKDLKDIQEVYANQAEILLEEIKKIKT